MTVYQIVYEERNLDGKTVVERCECYKNERDAAFICVEYNEYSNIKWYYKPVDVYEELEEANSISIPVEWQVTFINGEINSIDRVAFVVDRMDDWELEEDSDNVGGRRVVLKIRIEECNEDNIFKIAKKVYVAYMESNE